MKDKILQWYMTGEQGISSRNMTKAVLGEKMDYSNMTPSDPDDLNRCIKLVHMIPEIKEKFQEIAAFSDNWREVIDNWDMLEKSFIDEAGIDWCKAKRAPKTYKLMKELGL